MKEGTLQAYRVFTTEEVVCDVRVLITDEKNNRYMLDPRDLQNLPLGTYRIKGDVVIGDKRIIIDDTVTLSKD